MCKWLNNKLINTRIKIINAQETESAVKENRLRFGNINETYVDVSMATVGKIVHRIFKIDLIKLQMSASY